ncbi:MAG: hypothetical protein IT425_10630 [Pirellulales bacterium]|nr:hypothetical protein [Pirellulales bacterium]
MMRTFHHLLSFAILLATAFPAFAGSFFSTDFSSPTLHSELQDADSAFSISGGNTSLTSFVSPTSRHYIRTVDSDYFSSPTDFTYELTFTSPFSDPGVIQFIGLGDGSPTGPSGEPGSGSLNLRIHGPNVVSGRVDLGYNGSLVPGYMGIGYIGTTGPHRLRLSSLGSLLTFQIDVNYNGTFGADIASSIDLSNPAHSSILGALNSSSRLFFGTALPAVDYDDMLVESVVPEPGFAFLLFAAVGLLACRRNPVWAALI